MANKSFVLKKYGLGSEFGSYLKYPPGNEAASAGLPLRDDNDTSIRADDVRPQTIASNPIIVGGEYAQIATFDVTVRDYNEVIISWGAPLMAVLTSEFLPSKVIICYSDLGEPQTIADGTVLIETDHHTSIVHKPESGKWAYYSIFIKYETIFGQVYYELGASLAELLPFNYGSSDDLYSRVPEYYRILDGNLDDGNGGPLYRMLSVFGFEIDRTRTTIDYLMSAKDPLNANSETLNIIAQDLSLPMRADELGAARLRELLHNVGTFRRSLGTGDSLIGIAEAAAGSATEIDYENHIIKVYAQRVNLIKDPNIENGAVGAFIGGVPTSTLFTYEFEAGSASTPAFDETYSGGSPYSSPTATGQFTPDPGAEFKQEISGDELWKYFPDPLGGGSVSVLAMSHADVPIKYGEKLYFSIQGDFATNAQKDVYKVSFYTPGSGSSSAGYTGASTDVLAATSSEPITIAGIRYWELDVTNSNLVDYTNSFLTVFAAPQADLRYGFRRMLLERMLGGKYFDGNTKEGGWLVDYPSMMKVSDYHWYNPDDPTSHIDGTESATYSVFNGNCQKTRATFQRFLPSVLPVTQLCKTGVVYSNALTEIDDPVWQLKWNAIPGVQYPTEMVM